jgi:DNA-binding HxlR family transcriptional regulator
MLVPLGHALSAVGDRWSLAVIAALLDGGLTYGELQERVGRIAPNVLAKRLRHLEDEGLLTGRPYSRRPLRYRYELTDDGRELAGAIRLLADWGARHAGEAGEPARHELCGTPLEVRWWCPSCELAVGDGGPDDEQLIAV